MPVSCDQMGHDGRRWEEGKKWPRYERTGMRYSTLRSACDLPQRSFGDVACAQGRIWHSHEYEAACGRRFQGGLLQPQEWGDGIEWELAAFSPRHYIRHRRQRWRLAGKIAGGPAQKRAMLGPAPWIAFFGYPPGPLAGEVTSSSGSIGPHFIFPVGELLLI
jgi:hypothetical protein